MAKALYENESSLKRNNVLLKPELLPATDIGDSRLFIFPKVYRKIECSCMKVDIIILFSLYEYLRNCF